MKRCVKLMLLCGLALALAMAACTGAAPAQGSAQAYSAADSQNGADENAATYTESTNGNTSKPADVDSLYLEGVGDMVGIVVAPNEAGFTMEGSTVEVSDDGLFSRMGEDVGAGNITVEYAPNTVFLLSEYNAATHESTCFLASPQDMGAGSSVTLWGIMDGDIFIADAVRIFVLV